MARKAKLVNCAAIQIIEGKTLVLCRGSIGKCVHNTLHSKEACEYKKACIRTKKGYLRKGKAKDFLCTSWNAKKELFEQLWYEMEQEE
jgi:hypothetical protein